MASKNNVQPLIAHPERNRELLAEQHKFSWLQRQGCMFQVTAGALTGRFGDKVEDFALSMMRNKAFHVVASDTHDLVRRPNDMSTAYEVVSTFSDAFAQEAFVTRPSAIVSFDKKMNQSMTSRLLNVFTNKSLILKWILVLLAGFCFLWSMQLFIAGNAYYSVKNDIEGWQLSPDKASISRIDSGLGKIGIAIDYFPDNALYYQIQGQLFEWKAVVEKEMKNRVMLN